MLQNLGWVLYPVAAIGFFVYMCVVTVMHAENRRRHLEFIAMTLVYFALLAFLLTLLLYGSSYSMHWDYSRWRWGDTMGPFPITMDNSGVVSNTMIPKSSATFWWLAFLASSFYVSLPQAVVRGLNTRLLDRVPSLILGTLSNVVGVGEGFLALILTLTAIASPVPPTNGWLLLLSCLLIILLSGYDLSGMGVASLFLQPLGKLIQYWMQRAIGIVGKIVFFLISCVATWLAGAIIAGIFEFFTHTSPDNLPTAFLVILIVPSVGFALWVFYLLNKHVGGLFRRLVELLGVSIVEEKDVL